jgi:cobaltochelatase CobT
MADETPLDRFKTVLTGASRAISHEPEVEVAWTADAPAQSGKNFKLPMPGRSLPRSQAMEARGFADSFALKLRHHDVTLHAKSAPSEAVARACYDEIEAVRYEALGAKAYAGMRDNLAAAMDVRVGANPIARATRSDEVPMCAIRRRTSISSANRSGAWYSNDAATRGKAYSESGSKLTPALRHNPNSASSM